jgi:hypothetical protein
VTEIEPGVTVTIQTIDLLENARTEIRAAREQGIDPNVLIRTHRRTADLMEQILARPTDRDAS